MTGRPVARKLEATRCTDEALTLCRLDGPVKLQLRGAPVLSKGTSPVFDWSETNPYVVDTQYTMISPHYLKGNTNNAIIAGSKASHSK